MSRPNLLFIFADQMRGFDMGCAANAEVQTPHLDALARSGARVPLAFANCPVCGPSRAVLLTGRYPLSTGALANDLPLPEETPTIGERAKSAGYRTGYIGKWHLDGVPRAKWTPPGPRRHGFDDWAAFNCAHSYFKGRCYGDGPEPIALPGYEPEAQTDLALRFLERRDERPFCLFLSYGPPHDPYNEVPDRYKALYLPGDLTLRPNVQELKTQTPDGARRLGARPCLALYYAAITALDAQVGRLLAALRKSGQEENTIVVFTSDHGDMLFSQGMLKKQQPYEEAVRIPFLLRWPGQIPTASEPNILLSTVDFVPTLLALMGLSPDAKTDGADVSEALRGGTVKGPESVFLMEIVTTDEGIKQGIVPWRGVRTKRYTYARLWNKTPWLLYDNHKDPMQRLNRVSDPALASVQAQLEATLEGWLTRTGDRSGSGEDMLRGAGLAALWNAREKELNGSAGQYL